MSQENLQEQEQIQLVSKSPDIQALIRESREILKDKFNVSDKIKEYKQQLYKANRDQQMAQYSKDKAATQTPALANNSSMSSVPVSTVLGKRKDRDTEMDESNKEFEQMRETPSKRQKYTHLHEEGATANKDIHPKLTSIVAQSALKKQESHEDMLQKQEPKLQEETPASFEDKKAQRAQKFQEVEPQKPVSKQASADNITRVDHGRQTGDNGQIKRTRNLFSNMMKHLEKAKTRLESEKDLLGKQEQVVQKVSEKLMKDSSQIQEIQISVIEERLNQEIDKKRELERKLIRINGEVKNLKHVDQLRRLSHFIKSEQAFSLNPCRAKPQLFWMPAKHNEKTYACFQKSKQAIENEILDYKKESEKKLEERLKQYDEKVQQLNEKRHHTGSLLEKSQPREKIIVNEVEKSPENQKENKQPIEGEEEKKENLDDFDVDEDEDLINDIYALH